MKTVLLVFVLCIMPAIVNAQGSDILPAPLPAPGFPTPGLPVPNPGGGVDLPQVIPPEKKAAAGVAADHYDAIAQGADNFTGYWCNLNVLVCGYMADTAAVMRIYSAGNRRIQRDPIDPNFMSPFDPVLPDAASLGLRYFPDSDPAAPYFNWMTGNAQSFWAWAEMSAVTADRAATCILLQADSRAAACAVWQMQRLAMGLENMAVLEDELGSQIAPQIRDYLWSQGLGGEGWLLNEVAETAIEAARDLRGVTSEKSGDINGSAVDMR